MISATRLRLGVLGLGAVTTLALAAELAVERHWTQLSQLIAWAALVTVGAAIGLAYWRPTPRGLRVARALALLGRGEGKLDGG